jgi:hypothetical protein
MQDGAASLEKAARASEILELVQDGEVNTARSTDMTHALLSEVGGEKVKEYIVRSIPTRRVFRSKFAEFWFKKMGRLAFFSSLTMPPA